MSGRPFALLASRDEDVAADDEYASFLRHGGLRPEELVRVRMEAGTFTPLDLDRFAGVILGGSPFTASVPEDGKSAVQRRVEAELGPLLDEVLRRDLPFLGVCYGVGTLVSRAGGTVDGTFAENTSAVRVSVTEAGRRDPLLRGLPETFEAYVGHKEACTSLPSGAVVLATSEACPVQMLRIGANQYVTQFHPEMDRDALVTRIEVYRHAGYFPADEADAVVERVSRADVGASHAVVRAFVERYRDRSTVDDGARAATATAVSAAGATATTP
ncbi:GMP synthase (glutamine-hydrolysing) [Georgenia soli]|uniref:GMP synthase (Glutamine-hydrolysing) n=1 Tax=Georgenia soli TaxID=638953 RepID=A0A2A9EPZ8_9MICO|nr:glutamine amidotransferase [Georgenia soli]PFG40279.1 GMP synthase (glutamine-hydrolysing) [Georgenia soli]